MSDSKTIIFNGKNKPFEEKTFELNQNISQDQVLVKITLSTVCGSDVHTWLGDRPFPTPCVLGHEMVGKIVKLGNNVKEDFDTFTCFIDEGVGVILKKKNRLILQKKFINFKKITFKEFYYNYKELMNIVSYDKIEDYLNI